MKFAIRIPAHSFYPPISSSWEAHVTGEDTMRFARTAEDCGFDCLWVSEHIVMDPDLVPVMGSRFYDGLTAVTALLGATRRIRAMTYVAVLPYHHPVVYAKAIATADVLSNGRLTLGLGVGHMRREFEALGVPYERRGAISDEYLRAMKQLWTSERPTFHGEFVRFDDIRFEPKPVQKPHPPILIGGDSRAALKRAAVLGDGWLPWVTPRRELSSCFDYIREQRSIRGRVGPFEVYMMLLGMPDEHVVDMSRFQYPRERDEVMRLAEQLQVDGATTAVVQLPPGTADFKECLDWVEWFAKDIIPAFKGKS